MSANTDHLDIVVMHLRSAQRDLLRVADIMQRARGLGDHMPIVGVTGALWDVNQALGELGSSAPRIEAPQAGH